MMKYAVKFNLLNRGTSVTIEQFRRERDALDARDVLRSHFLVNAEDDTGIDDPGELLNLAQKTITVEATN